MSRARVEHVPRRRETLDGAELRARDAGRGATRGRRRLGGDHDAGRGGDRRRHHCDARGFARGCAVSRPPRARAIASRSIDGWAKKHAHYDVRTRAWVLYRAWVMTRGHVGVGVGGQRCHESRLATRDGWAWHRPVRVAVTRRRDGVVRAREWDVRAIGVERSKGRVRAMRRGVGDVGAGGDDDG